MAVSELPDWKVCFCLGGAACLGCVQPEEACTLVDSAEHDACSRDVAGHCCVPVRSLKGIETIDFELTQLGTVRTPSKD